MYVINFNLKDIIDIVIIMITLKFVIISMVITLIIVNLKCQFKTLH